ncbi:portal protein, partial [Escherichia coli]|uniref:portal protein n=1 Tax=Escherichia coli TaxID=562 RepID=UPI001964B072
NVDASLYELNFNPPMYFGDFAQIERDAAQINVFQPMSEVKYMSKRFLLKRFLGLSEDEILENEKMWLEENKDATQNSGADGAVGTADAPGLDSIGLR